MILTEEQKQAIKNIVNQRDWPTVQGILLEYLNQLKDITLLSEDEKKKDMNIVVLARIQAYHSLLKFLQKIALVSQKTSPKKEEDFYE